MNEYLVRVKEFLSEYTEDLDQVTEHSQFIADLGFNSLEMMQIVNDAEMEFDIEISDEELLSLHTVGDFIELLQTKE